MKALLNKFLFSIVLLIMFSAAYAGATVIRCSFVAPGDILCDNPIILLEPQQKVLLVLTYKGITSGYFTVYGGLRVNVPEFSRYHYQPKIEVLTGDPNTVTLLGSTQKVPFGGVRMGPNLSQIVTGLIIVKNVSNNYNYFLGSIHISRIESGLK